MYRSQKGLEGAGEWHQLQPLFPNLEDKKVLDLGCGYGWHCKYAVECGAKSVLGIDLSEKMIYVDDLDTIYNNIYKTLKKNGVFLFNIEHPVFTGSINQELLIKAKKLK